MARMTTPRVESPVREHRDRNQKRCSARYEQSADEESQQRPRESGRQAVRVRHVIEVQRQRAAICPGDARLLHAEENEHSPDDIDKLNGHKEDPEWNPPLDTFYGEGHAVMSDEHCVYLYLSR